MRKFKLLFAACALFGVTVAQARTDVTDTYLTDANLSSLAGWGNPGRTDWKTDGAVNVVEFWNWSNQFSFTQTVNLPAGNYRLAVNSFYRESWGGNGTNNNMAWIFAGEKKQNVAALNAMTDLSSYAGSNDLYRAATAFSLGKFSNEFDFVVEGGGETVPVEIGFKGTCPNGGWCILGPVKLYQYTIEDYLDDYDTKYSAAEAIKDHLMNIEVNSALLAAMVDRNTLTTVAEVTAAIQALSSATAAANTSIADYVAIKAAIDAADAQAAALDAAGKAAYDNNVDVSYVKYGYENGYFDSNSLAIIQDKLNAAIAAAAKAQTTPNSDMTGAIVNPSFESGINNGWYYSGMQTQNNTAFAKTGTWYAEAFQPNGTKFVRQTITGLRPGSYKLTASCLARGVTSAKLFAVVGDAEIITDIYIEDNVSDYDVEFTVGNDGTIDIGFEGVGTGEVNSWLCTDNFRLTFLHPTLIDVTAAQGYTTYYNTEKAVKAYTPGVTLYTVTAVSGTDAILTEVDTAPAGTPLIIDNQSDLEAIQLEEVEVTPTTMIDPVDYAPEFLGAGAETEIGGSDADNYVLYNGQFVWVKNRGNIAAGKCYLDLSGYWKEARSIRLVIGGTTDTGVAAVKKAETGAAVYSLDGRQVANPAKGIYVKDGKKIVIK